jgi:hypothetical protein
MNNVFFSGLVQVEEANGAVKGTVGTVPVWTNKPDIGGKLMERNGKYALVQGVASAREKDGRYYNSLFMYDVVPAGPDTHAGTLYARGIIEAVRTIKQGFHELILATNRNGRTNYIALSTNEDYSDLVGKEATVVAQVSGRDGRWLDFRSDWVFVEGVARTDLPF